MKSTHQSEIKDALEAGKKAEVRTFRADTLYITKTDTIKARYLKLPIVDLSVRYLVEVLTPVHLVLTEKVISRGRDLNDPLAALSLLLLDEWRSLIKEGEFPEDHWINRVNRVELIECELKEKP